MKKLIYGLLIFSMLFYFLWTLTSPEDPLDSDSLQTETLEISINKALRKGEYSRSETTLEDYKAKFPDDLSVSNKVDSLLKIVLAAKEEAVKNKEKAKAMLGGFRSKVDEFNDVTYYFHKTSTKYNNRNAFYCYFAMDNDGNISPLRLRVQYYADDWLFIERCEILADKDKFVYSPGTFDRDNDTKIWETNDSPVNDITMLMLEAMSESKTVKIRFIGNQYYKDKTLSATQLKALKEVLFVYKSLSTPIL